MSYNNDPLGWLSPISMKVKLVLQKLAEAKLRRDEPLNGKLRSARDTVLTWKEWMTHIHDPFGW